MGGNEKDVPAKEGGMGRGRVEGRSEGGRLEGVGVRVKRVGRRDAYGRGVGLGGREEGGYRKIRKTR